MADVAQFNGKFHRASEPSPGVLLLELNRGPVNAFHDPFWTEMRDILQRVSACHDIRVVVLSSAREKIFTAGLDLNNTSIGSKKAEAVDAARKAIGLWDHIKDFQDAIGSIERCRQPVIGAFYGHSIGLGVDIASACDVRLCASNVIFGILEVKVGLAADIGTLQRFPKIVANGSKARELALTGRMFYADEAKEIGFVSDVVKGGRAEVIDAALKLAKTIAANSPVAVVGTKHIITYSRDHSVADGLAYQAAWNMSMLQSEDTSMAMKAQMAKKPAVYRSLGAKL